MKYLTNPEFNKKLRALNDFELIQVGNVVNYLQNTDKELIYQNATLLAEEDEDVYSVGSKEARVYFTMGSDDTGEYLLLLDFTVQSKIRAQKQKEFFALKDPKRNKSLNPIYNHRINPIYTHSINPIYNHRINPIYNHRINPIYNHRINPIYNHRINPIYNHRINPIYNHSINPIYNHSINPIYNRSFGGPFIYSKDLTQEGYMVQANDKVYLLFNMSAKWIGIGVQHSSGVIIIFDTKNKNTGYLIPTPEKVYLRFGAGAKWAGIVV